MQEERTTPSIVRLMALVALGVAVAGELKVHPFDSAFRFTLGPPVLLLSLLVWPRLPPIPTGVAAGLTVFAFRSALATLDGSTGFQLGILWDLHGAATIYYLVCGLLARVLGLQSFGHQPLRLLGTLVAVDALPNVVELLLRHGTPLGSMLVSVFTVAGLRGAIVAGIYLIIRHQQAETRWEQQQREYTRMMLLLIDLNAELFLLRKSSRDIEDIMARSYRLYQELESANSQGSRAALEVARDVHEIKKDYQRILAGLDRIVRRSEMPASMALSEVVAMVVEAGHNYAAMLEKNIQFTAEVRHDFATPHFSHWVSVLNNLVTNAIEACAGDGKVQIKAWQSDGKLQVTVADNGPGIDRRDWEVIFRPGYSTKVDPGTGQFSTGLGLNHVQTLVQELGGDVQVAASGPAGTVFQLVLPQGGAER